MRWNPQKLSCFFGTFAIICLYNADTERNITINFFCLDMNNIYYANGYDWVIAYKKKTFLNSVTCFILQQKIPF